VWRFVNLICEAVSYEDQAKLRNDSLYKIVLQGVRLMHLCDYHYSDVVLTLAYASVYFRIIHRSIGAAMSGPETAHVVVLLIFLAHSFVLDECCPLRCWQKYIFRKYCTVKVLDAALFKLFWMQEFRLKVSEDEEREALCVLLDQGHPLDVVLKHDSRCRLHQRSPNGDSQASQASTAASLSAENGCTPTRHVSY